MNIRGELCILKLEAATHDVAMEANLSGKEHMHKLMLGWSADSCTQQVYIEESERVIEALCPHTSVKHLQIDNYPGRRLPSWVEKLSSLESLEIISCPRLTRFSIGTTLQPQINVRIQ